MRLPEPVFFNILFKYFIYVFLERKGGREGEKHQCVVASRMPPTGDLALCPGHPCALIGNPTGDPLVHSPGAQSIEPHQPGQTLYFNTGV